MYYVGFLAPLVWALLRTLSKERSATKGGGYAAVRREILARQVNPPSRVPCTVMDWRAEEETMTLVVHPDASALIYALKQEGTLGDAFGDAQGPARRFLRAVEQRRGEMHSTEDYREPPPGHACFWIVEPDWTFTSGDVPLVDLKFRMSNWTAAYGSGSATVHEVFESFRLHAKARAAAAAKNVAPGPRSV